jgi:hypothetical protein
MNLPIPFPLALAWLLSVHVIISVTALKNPIAAPNTVERTSVIGLRCD